MARSITLKNYVTARTALEGRFPAVLARAAQLAALRGVAFLVAATDKAKKVDRGDFKRGWQGRAEGSSQVRITFWNARPHAPVVEYGRRPGRKPPPVKIIERWLVRKGMSKVKAAEVAWPVARAIGRRGIPGVHILDSSFAEIEKLILDEVQGELEAAIRL